MRLHLTVAVLAIATITESRDAISAAKKPPAQTPSCPGTPGPTAPRPIRKVIIKPVGTRAFQLPNGTRVDLAADLESILSTAVASTSSFSPADPSPPGQSELCDTHLEIRAAVTTLDLNAFEAGVSFGYTPSGEKPTSDGLNVNAKVRVGTIAMDFSVWKCVSGRCSAVAATTADHLTASVNLTFDVHFGEVSSAPSLIYNTPLGGVLRAIMMRGMGQLSSSPRLNELPWFSRVREFIPEIGAFYFDAGTQSKIGVNQTFVVYAVTPSTGICEVYRAVAHGHTTHVETVSSLAIVDQSLDPRGIRQGDLVMVRVGGSSR